MSKFSIILLQIIILIIHLAVLTFALFVGDAIAISLNLPSLFGLIFGLIIYYLIDKFI